jgi:hypothetical protein
MATESNGVFDKALRKLVTKTGHSLNKVSMHAQISYPLVWKWWNNQTNLSDESVAKLAKYLGTRRGLGEAVHWLMLLNHYEKGSEWLQSRFVQYADDEENDPEHWAKAKQIVEEGDTSR